MAGMNRLGSGPKKPGIVRPIDPNRFVAKELKPEGVEGDLEYAKLVKEVEEGIGGRQAGWLFGRGAFDKTDLQYLKDEEDKNKYSELEQTAQEKAKFARLRALQDVERSSSEQAAGSLVMDLAEHARNKKKEQATISKQSQLLARVVKVKKVGSVETGGERGGEQACRKRARTEGGTGIDSEPFAKTATSEHEDVPTLPGLLGDYGSESDE